MKAMILAAGLGKRMAPLTDTTPKPLLKVAGKALIVYHLERIANAGIKEVLINTSYLAEQIEQALGCGEKWGLHIQYSREEQPLETAGAIVQALAFFEQQPFVLINADIWTDFDLKPWLASKENASFKLLAEDVEAHLLLVPNPSHNPDGDFSLPSASFNPQQGEQIHTLVCNIPQYTFAGVSMMKPAMFKGLSSGKQALAPLIREKIEQTKVSGELYNGTWVDVGTPERLAQINSL